MGKAGEVLIHIDGGARGNPGPAAAGVVITTADGKQKLFQGGFYLGKATNNVAEYTGLLKALEQARKLGARKLEIVSDSELMVRQINGQYRVKNEGLKPLFDKAVAMLGKFDGYRLRHVRREQNTAADQRVNQALNLQANVGDAAR